MSARDALATRVRVALSRTYVTHVPILRSCAPKQCVHNELCWSTCRDQNKLETYGYSLRPLLLVELSFCKLAASTD